MIVSQYGMCYTTKNDREFAKSFDGIMDNSRFKGKLL